VQNLGPGWRGLSVGGLIILFNNWRLYSPPPHCLLFGLATGRRISFRPKCTSPGLLMFKYAVVTFQCILDKVTKWDTFVKIWGGWSHKWLSWNCMHCSFVTLYLSVCVTHVLQFQIRNGRLEIRIQFYSQIKHHLKSSVLWDITPCSPLKTSRLFGGTCRLHFQGRKKSVNQKKTADLAICFILVYCLAYSLTLKMQPTCSSETSVDF
jgi:hypothetical protein